MKKEVDTHDPVSWKQCGDLEAAIELLQKIPRLRAFFYMTSDWEQAAAWARRVARVRRHGESLVSVFETNDNWEGLRLLRFKTANRDWLDFVTGNRTESPSAGGYDVIVGPIANDRTIDVLNLYLSGVIPAEIALELLLPQKLKDQYVLKTEPSLNAIRFLEVKRP